MSKLFSSSIISTPPGATIWEQLNFRDISVKTFAKDMGISTEQAEKLICGSIPLTPNMAMRLETVLGIPASFWNQLETTYRKKKRIQDQLEQDQEKPVSIFDVAKYILEQTGGVNSIKLQRLCYYSQAWSLACDHVPLFSEDFHQRRRAGSPNFFKLGRNARLSGVFFGENYIASCQKLCYNIFGEETG